MRWSGGSAGSCCTSPSTRRPEQGKSARRRRRARTQPGLGLGVPIRRLDGRASGAHVSAPQEGQKPLRVRAPRGRPSPGQGKRATNRKGEQVTRSTTTSVAAKARPSPARGLARDGVPPPSRSVEGAPARRCAFPPRGNPRADCRGLRRTAASGGPACPPPACRGRVARGRRGAASGRPARDSVAMTRNGTEQRPVRRVRPRPPDAVRTPPRFVEPKMVGVREPGAVVRTVAPCLPNPRTGAASDGR
jgi:hypothetical protein